MELPSQRLKTGDGVTERLTVCTSGGGTLKTVDGLTIFAPGGGTLKTGDGVTERLTDRVSGGGTGFCPWLEKKSNSEP